MEGDLYDEFGNYIGPELESDESEEEEGDREEDEEQGNEDIGLPEVREGGREWVIIIKHYYRMMKVRMTWRLVQWRWSLQRRRLWYCMKTRNTTQQQKKFMDLK